MKTIIKIPVNKDKERFLSMAERQSRKHEMLAWVRENCDDPYDHVRIYDSPGYFGAEHTLDFYFEDKDEALRFKLVWG